MTREPRTSSPSPRMQRLEELRHQAMDRRRLLERAERHLIAGDFLLAIDDIVSTVKMLSHAEETVMELHTECFAMIEQSRKILELDAARRPLIVQLETPSGNGDHNECG